MRMVAFSFWRQTMRWCFFVQMDDCGRMQSRVLQVTDHMMVSVENFSSTKLDERFFLSFTVKGDDKQAGRIESLLRKIHGVRSVEVIPEIAANQRMIALLRVRCDISERDEILHFIAAIAARTIMIRPLWLAFEVVGTPQEVEGIYQTALGYGMVDLVSSSSVFISSSDTRICATQKIGDEATMAYL
jgi:acetolactate synthase small subunit